MPSLSVQDATKIAWFTLTRRFGIKLILENAKGVNIRAAGHYVIPAEPNAKLGHLTQILYETCVAYADTDAFKLIAAASAAAGYPVGSLEKAPATESLQPYVPAPEPTRAELNKQAGRMTKAQADAWEKEKSASQWRAGKELDTTGLRELILGRRN